MQEQIEITKNNLLIADTLCLNMQNKYSQGIVRQQDLNDAETVSYTHLTLPTSDLV